MLWERGAETAPEDVASPTITTITPQQGDEDVSRTKSQSNASSGHKDTANLQNNTNKQGVISENGGNAARPLPSWARKRFPEKDIAELVRLSYAEYLQRNGRTEAIMRQLDWVKVKILRFLFFVEGKKDSR